MQLCELELTAEELLKLGIKNPDDATETSPALRTELNLPPEPVEDQEATEPG